MDNYLLLRFYAGEELTGNYEQLKYHDKSAEERQLQQMNSVLKQLAQNIK